MKTAQVARLTLPLVSVATGVTSFAVLIGHLVPYPPLAFGLGGVLLIGWEYLKALAVERTAESTLGGGSYPVALGLFTLLLSVGSIGFSLHGTYEASRLLDTTEAENVKVYGHAKDSISAYYDQQIAQARADAKAYFGANVYPVYFDWRVHHQDTLVKDHLSGQRFTLSLDDLHAFFASVAPTLGCNLSPTLPPTEGTKTIGFEFGKERPKIDTPNNPPLNSTKIVTNRKCEHCGKEYTPNHNK